MAATKGLPVQTLRGGFDDDTNPHMLDNDKCTVARNVEFYFSMLGERRFGCGAVNLVGSGLEALDVVVHMKQWYPTNDPTAPEWFVVAATAGASLKAAKRSSAGTWTALTFTDAPATTEPAIYKIRSQELNQKLFIAYQTNDSSIDRLHVLDHGDTVIRRTGLGQPAAPAVVTEGSGSYKETRFFRVRYIREDGNGNILVRSEPSSSTTFNPPGTGAGATISRPALLGEGETHWEVEASNNNTDFYVIQTLPIATTSYNDTTAGGNSVTTVPAGIAIPPGYVQLSDLAAALNLTGTVSNGAYANPPTFPARGWVMYTGAGAYVPEGWVGHVPPVAGDVVFASQDVALVLEQTVGDGTSYASIGTLSESIGAYLTQPAAKFLLAVDSRLVYGGNFNIVAKQSSVYWTPPTNDPGKGSDERFPSVTTGGASINSSLDMDKGAGGAITDLGDGIVGSWYVFKQRRIYKMNATRNLTTAYQSISITTERGAIEGSVFAGLDQDGKACLFFLDQAVGPFMFGAGGMLQLFGLKNTWKRVNISAANIVARGMYYPDKKQAHWWVAVDGSTYPNFKFVNQVSELRPNDQGGLHRGWSLWDGRLTEARCCALLSDFATENGHSVQRYRPYIGLNAGALLQICDSDFTTDAGTIYTARVRTKPFFAAGLLDNWGAMVAAMLVAAVNSTTFTVQLIKDLGKDGSTTRTVNCDPQGANVEFLIADLDDLFVSESRSIAVEYGDPT